MATARWMSDEEADIRIRKYWVPVAGHRMHCLQAGAGPALILLHGLLGTASTWEPVIPSLAEHSTLYAIDALGMGESDRVHGIDPTLEAQADRVIAFMDQSGVDAADFAGTSHGGAVAMALAAKYPERVNALILNAPANPFSRLDDPLIEFYLSRLGTRFAHCVPRLPRRLHALALGRMYGDPTRLRDGSLAKYVQSLRTPGTVAYVLSMLKCWNEDMRNLALERLQAFQALLLWGELDRAVTLESGRQLRRSFACADWVVLPGAGHLPFEECPEEFAHSVNSFLTRVRNQPGLRLTRSLQVAEGA